MRFVTLKASLAAVTDTVKTRCSVYSAIVVEECDALALSWRDLAEVEKLQRAAEVRRLQLS